MEQTIITETRIPQARTEGVAIPVEWVAYFALFLLALAFRLMSLGDVPMSVQEAPDALAAWRTVWTGMPAFPEEAVTSSPSVFWAQKIGFTLFGGSEFAARLLTALAGTALAFTPLLFRADLGRTRTFIFCLLLTFSPISLLASRTSAGVIWAALFAMLGIWALRRYWTSNQGSDAVGAILAFAALLFLSEPGGILLALVLLLAAIIAVILNTVEQIDETPNPAPFSEISRRVGSMPFLSSLAIAIGVIIAVTTGFLTYSQGLSGVAELVGGFFSGWTQRAAEAPRFYPLLVSFFYEPILWLFAGIGIVMLLRRRDFILFDRFFLTWTGLALLAALIYAGADASYALYLTIPLAGLASYTIANCFTEERSIWSENLKNDEVPSLSNVHWGKALLAVVMLGFLAMLSMHLQIIGRTILTIEGGTLDGLFAQSSNTVIRASMIWTFITVLFIIVGGLLAASVWGNTTALQGLALGLLAFMLINGLSAAWSAGVSDADNPAEPWHTRATAPDTVLLRNTMAELAQRETLGYFYIPVTVVQDASVGLARDGVVAWILRDFRNVSFVNSVEEARSDEIIIMRPQAEEPDLGGSYVGQPFTITNEWDTTTLRGFDFISWWFQRQTRTQPVPLQDVVLWVRLDIYESVPLERTSQLMFLED
jgi:hypothetical protein